MPGASESIAGDGLRLPRHPQDVCLSVLVVATGEHKQQIRQPIEIDDDLLIDRFAVRQRDGLALGTAAHRSSQVTPGRSQGAARKYKARKRLEARIESVNCLLQAL